MLNNLYKIIMANIPTVSKTVCFYFPQEQHALYERKYIHLRCNDPTKGSKLTFSSREMKVLQLKSFSPKILQEKTWL